MFKNIIYSLPFIFILSCNSDKKEATASSKLNDNPSFSGIKDRAWWKEAIIYQIYPRSFKDSDGDGVGDLKGIISKLDYLKNLGINAVWLNPIYSSPNDDNGYDISDYRNILAEFGTMEDFNALLKGMHDRGIKLVMDLVVNHSSDEHEWFKQARSSRSSPYRDYYHWWNGERGKPNPRYSFFDVNNDAWRYDSLTNAYYLHYFSVKQPDLNWENPKVREEVYSIMKYWLDKGIDGFRMDAFQFVSKDTSFPALPKDYTTHLIEFYGKGAHLHDYIQEMNKKVLSKYDIMTVAEGAGANSDDAMKFVDPDRHELNMAYHFEAIDMAFQPGPYPSPYPEGYNRTKLKKVFTHWDSAFAKKGWLSIYMANHDQPRMVSHWGNDNSAYRDLSSKMLTTFVLSMRGTPYYYYGDELGMTNIRFDSISEYNDLAVRNRYKQIKEHGGDGKAFLEAMKYSSRDNGRTPFQWDSTSNAGFTTGKPWLMVNPNYLSLNAAAQERDPNSPLNYFRMMVALRKNSPALIYGAYQLIETVNDNFYVYTRTQGEEKLLVLLNFGNDAGEVKLPSGLEHFSNGSVLINNYPDPTVDLSGGVLHLKPWQALIIK